jgi:hypothetical protein
MKSRRRVNSAVGWLFFRMNRCLAAIICVAFVIAPITAQTKHLRLRPSKNYWDWAGGRAHVHYISLSNGRRLAAVGDTLYMLNRHDRILWRWDSGGPPLNDLPFIDSRGIIYAIGMDLLWVAIDSANGREKWRGTANGRATYWQIVPYRHDMYFVVTNMEAYRSPPIHGVAVNDELTLCRGNSILWTTEIPAAATLRVNGSKVFLTLKRRRRTITRNVTVPAKLDKPIGRVSALAPEN